MQHPPYAVVQKKWSPAGAASVPDKSSIPPPRRFRLQRPSPRPVAPGWQRPRSSAAPSLTSQDLIDEIDLCRVQLCVTGTCCAAREEARRWGEAAPAMEQRSSEAPATTQVYSASHARHGF
jgi:hypothetical protein